MEANGGRPEAAFIRQEDILEEFDVEDEVPPLKDDDDEDEDNDGDPDGGLELPPGVRLVVEEEIPEDGEAMEAPDIAIETFSGHTGPVYAVAISPKDPTEMLTGGGDDRAFFWKASSLLSIAPPAEDSSSLVKELDNHGDSINAVGFSFDGTMAATGAYSGKLMIWDTKSKSLIRTLEGPEDIEWLDWHSKGYILLAGSKDGTIWMWLASTGDCIKVFAGHEGPVTCGMFTADGKNIVSGSADGTVRVWGPKNGLCKHVFQGYGFHEGAINALASHHEGELLLTGYGFHEDAINALASHHEGELLLTGYGFHEGVINALASHHGRKLLLTGGMDGTARLVHVQNKKILATLVHSEPKAMEAGGYGGGEAGEAQPTPMEEDRHEEEEEGKEDQMMEEEGSLREEGSFSVETVGFSKVFNWCATGGMDGSLKIWDLGNYHCRHVCVHGSGGGVVKLVWHETAPLVYTGCTDGVIRLWDARSGQLLQELTGHEDMILDFAVHCQPAAADGGLRGGGDVILSGSDDGKAKVFSVSF